MRSTRAFSSSRAAPMRREPVGYLDPCGGTPSEATNSLDPRASTPFEATNSLDPRGDTPPPRTNSRRPRVARGPWVPGAFADPGRFTNERLHTVQLTLQNRCMSYKSLTSPTMVTVSGPWTDPNKERPFIATLPQAGALLPSLDAAHEGLLDTQASGVETNAALAKLQRAEAVLDLRHDRKTRGVFNVLTGFADLAEDPEQAAIFLALRDEINPKGLDVTRWSYTDEAGEVELVARRLSQDQRVLLGSLPTPIGTLLDALEARIQAGRELGKLETERAGLEKRGPDATTAADAMRARNVWIRTVTAFVAILDLEMKLSETDREKLLGPLRRAESRADRRAPSAEEAKVEEAKNEPAAEAAREK